MHRTTPTGPNATPLVSVTEAAAMLALSVVTVRRLVKNGELPSVRIGAAVRIPLTAVQALASPSAPAPEGLADADDMTNAPQRGEDDGPDGVS